MDEFQLDQLDELLDLDEGLTDWQLGFIESLNETMRSKGLSDKQAAKLQEIHEQVIQGVKARRKPYEGF